MSQCVYCKKLRKKWKQLTFHRFPKDSEWKQKWIDSIGWMNWQPKETHALCSDHFPKGTIDFRDSRARLRLGTVPIFNVDIKNPQAIDSHESMKRRKIEEPLKNSADNSQERLPIVPLIERSSDTQGMNRGPLITNSKSVLKETTNGKFSILHQPSVSINEDQDVMQIVHHDHSYHKTNEENDIKLSTAKLKIKQLQMRMQALKRKDNRAQMKLKNLADIIKNLRETNKIRDNGSYFFSCSDEITMQLSERMQQNLPLRGKTKKLSKKKYPTS